MKKRVLTLCLAYVFLLGLLPTAALATEELSVSGTYNDTMSWSLSTDGTLTISGTGVVVGGVYDSEKGDFIPLPWDEHCDDIRRIVLEEGITGIDGEWTFAGYGNLQSVSFPQSIKKIGYEAFMTCPALTNVTIPAGVTEIGERAFGFCERLVSITVDEKNPCYASIDGVLCNKEKTEILQYPSGRTDETYAFPSSVTHIGDASFQCCTHLKRIAIPDGILSVGFAAFMECEELADISIADSVTEIGYWAFMETGYYRDETKWDNNELYIGNYLIRVKEEQTGNYAVRSGTRAIAGGAFSRCNELTAITIPDSAVSLGDCNTFEDCGKITELVIPGGVTKIGAYTFSGCDNLERVALPDHLTSIGDHAFWMCKKLTALTLPDSITEIGEGAFMGCGFTEITIPSGVTEIKRETFCYCNDLTGVTIPESVTVIEKDAFNEGNHLTIKGYTDSYAEAYAKENNIPFVSLGAHRHQYILQKTVAPTCTEKGYDLYGCTCGLTERRNETAPAGHTWDSGVVTRQPTSSEKGEKTYTCTVCQSTRTEDIPVLSGGNASGYTSPSKPSVSVDGEGGKVTSDRNGTATITPDEGYQVEKIAINGKEVKIPADGRLTGLKPSDKVVVTFMKTPTATVKQFVDVTPGAWYYDAVKYAVEHGLFYGTSGATFSPDSTMTRGMLVTVLYRMESEPEADPADFLDVGSGKYYSEAVAWAAANGIVMGYGNGNFGPEDAITREQLAAILYHYSGSPATTGTLDSFTDAGKASGYALDALRWAAEQGILQGKGGGILDPAGNATRAEVAAMLMRYCETAKGDLKSPSAF